MSSLCFKRQIFTVFWIVLFAASQAQAQTPNKSNRLEGEVSYATSDNIYLRFKTTTPLVLGDTVYISDGNRFSPCLIIQQKSSVSCIATLISGCKIKAGDKVVYFYGDESETPPPVVIVPVVAPDPVTPVDSATPVVVKDSVPPPNKSRNSKPFYGRVSLANYATFNGTDINNRAMARLNFNADDIAGTGLSFRTYMNYRQSAVSRGETTWDQGRFNVYELALSQELSKSFSITAGRFINRKMASIGAIDGVAIDKSWDRIYAGIIGGFRPDPATYGLNTDLFQLGAYAGLFHNAQKSAYTNIGFINQNNGGATDRRYLFLQHQSTIAKKVYLFASSELDLYTETDTSGTLASSPRLTSLYFSVTYRPTSKLSLSGSYDIRQNVILYQSYQDNLENLLAYDPTRTGLRFGAVYNVTQRVRTGVNLSFRMQNDQRNDFYGVMLYTSISQLPGHGSLYLALSLNQNTAFRYQSAYLRYMLLLAKNKVSVTPYYRFVLHEYTQVDVNPAMQHYAGLDCSFRLTSLLSLGALYEYNLQQSWSYHRLNINLIQRF